MYARVAAFENRDTSRVAEMVETVKERAGSGHDFPDAKRVLMLVDREAGTALGITFFESEEAIRQAEPTFDRMGEEIPEALRGKRTSLDVYEAVLEDVADGAQAARVSRLEGSADRIDEGISFIKEQILPSAGDIPGWKGVVALADRSNGRTITITFWDSEESLEASEVRANELRSQAAKAMDETVVGVERYEVALSKALAPASV